MASLAAHDMTPLQKERAFFFYMALAILAAVVAGFGFFFAIGASSFNAPLWIHVHAVSMTVWVGLYLTQNVLIYRGHVAVHRKLGPIAAVWALWITLYGFWGAAMVVETGRVPPFFQPSFFLMMDWLNLVAFAGLFVAALRLRAHSDWHKRLMLGAMINLIAVAVARLVLPMLFDQRGMWLVMLILLGFFAAGMLFDRKERGAVHPAYFWGAGALVAWMSLTFVTASWAPVVAFTAGLQG